MISRHLRTTCVILSLSTLLLSGCGSGEENGREAAGQSTTPTVARPDAARAARASLPAHDPEARFSGKTALEYAQGLSDLNPDVQLEALMHLVQFGVNALPARDRVKTVIESGAPDFVKLVALGVLINMEAPEAVPLARAKLMDPTFGSDDDTYADIIDGLAETGVIDEETLRSDMLRLAQSDPDHAARLMALEELPWGVQEALTRALFQQEHTERAAQYFAMRLGVLDFLGDEPRIEYLERIVATDPTQAARMMSLRNLPEALQRALTIAIFNKKDESQTIQTHSDEVLTYFFRNLGALDYIDDDAKIAFVRDNAPFASRPAFIQGTHQVLLSVGTEEAMDVALRFGAFSVERSYPLMIQFAQSKVDPLVVFDRMLKDMDGATSQSLISQIAGYMELFARQVGQGEGGEPLRRRFLETMTALIEDGPTEDHRAYGALYLVSFVAQSSETPISALEPAFAVLGDTNAPNIVRGTAGSQLQEAAATLAMREGFIERTVQALWEGEDVNATHFPEQILLAAGGTVRGQRAGTEQPRLQRIIEVLVRDVDNHLDDWSVNPAAVVLMTFAANGRLNESSYKEAASIALGKLFASPHAHPDYVRESFNRHMHRILSGNVAYSNTLDGLIGLLEPFIFAEHETIIHTNNPRQWASRMSNPDTARLAMRSDPEARARWRAFLQRVADMDSQEHYSHVARSGLSMLDRAEERGG